VTDGERLAWIGLNMIQGLGPRRLRPLVASCGGAFALWRASYALLSSLVGPSLAARIVEQRRTIDPQRELDRVHEYGWQIITPTDPQYPPLLAEIYDPPTVLYCWGSPPQGSGVALVGTRQPTKTGRLLARILARDLAAQQVPVISGLARGIDAYAHWGAIENNGPTWAVLGSSLDEIYPPEHRRLIEYIVSRGGCILSEYPLGTKPARGHFPARNRIISGLASMVVIVEAPIKSGALITAEAALQQGREVGAVPASPLNSRGQGCNLLIQEGAKLIQSSQDILEEVIAAKGGN
jgi:DNA processing protein